MSLSIGIVGLPNVGKSTLFNALTKNNILAANYPFATIEPNTGIVPVPDTRLKQLATLFDSPKIVNATIKFVDIAGLVAGASKGEGLGNRFLAHIREVDAIAMVVRDFSKDDVQHVEQSIDPKRDIDIVRTELILADLQTIEKVLPTLSKQAKADPKLKPDVEDLEKLREQLDSNQFPSLSDEQVQKLKTLNLMTIKPIIYVFNVDEADVNNEQKQAELSQYAAPAESIFINAAMESGLKDMPENEAEELLQSVGVSESGLNKLIHSAYKTLGLQSFLTAGPKEVRAWTIKSGSTAPQAAGVIHTDFERGFISADVIRFDELMAAGSWTAARAAGKVRNEGKTYVMQEGDVVEFKFNV